MATVTTNSLIVGLHGKFGKMVFRTMWGKTFLSAMPRKPDKKKESEAQRNTRVTFKEATQWARSTLRDPAKKAYYQQRAKTLKLPNAYTAALTDYMRKPNIVKSRQGKTLHYGISKNGFAIKQVTATLTKTNGVENAEIKVQRHNGYWFVQYKPDVNAENSLLTLTIIDNTGRSNVITAYG